MNERANAHNRRLIALVEGGCTQEAELAALAEQSFIEHFGGMLTAWAAEAASAQGDDAVRHVDLDAEHQVSVANSIGHVMTRFRKHEVAAIAGYTINARGDVCIFGGGKTEEQNWLLGADFLRVAGITAITGAPAIAEDALQPVRVESGLVHTRDPGDQQAAVGQAIREVRRRHRGGEIEMVVGFTVDYLGRIRPFGGGETEGRLIERGVDKLKEFIGHLEKRYDQ